MANHFDKQFKLDAVQYYKEHAELGLEGLCQEPRGQPAVHIALEERTKRDRRPGLPRLWQLFIGCLERNRPVEA